MKIKMAFTATIFMSGCMVTYAPTALDIDASRALPAPIGQDEAEMVVKTAIERRLIDPTSPLYEFMPVVNSYYGGMYSGPTWGWFLCGTVNSKNRMGGYAGRTQFMARFDPANPEILAELYIDGRDSYSADIHCQDVYSTEAMHLLLKKNLDDKVEAAKTGQTE